MNENTEKTTNRNKDDFYFHLPELCEELDKSLSELEYDMLYSKHIPLEEEEYTKEDELLADSLDYLDEANKEDSRFIFFEHSNDQDILSPIIGVTVMSGKDKILVDHNFEKPIDVKNTEQRQKFPEKDLAAIHDALKAIDGKNVFCDRKRAHLDIKAIKKQYHDNLEDLKKWKQEQLLDFKGTHREYNFEKVCNFGDILHKGKTNGTISTICKTFFSGFVGDLKNRPSRVAKAAFKKHIAKDYSNRLEKIIEDYKKGRADAHEMSLDPSGKEGETYDPKYAFKRFSIEYRKLPLEERQALTYAKKTMDIWLAEYQRNPTAYKRPTVADFIEVSKEKLVGIKEMELHKTREPLITKQIEEKSNHKEYLHENHTKTRTRSR